MTPAPEQVQHAAARYLKTTVPDALEAFCFAFEAKTGDAIPEEISLCLEVYYAVALTEAYTTGAIEALKMAAGDFTPEPSNNSSFPLSERMKVLE
jgi:hypothetical protein